MKIKIVVIFLVFLFLNSGFSYYYHSKQHNQKHKYILSSDPLGYYQYLTAVFYEKDITKQYYTVLSAKGININKYNYGTALLELPFFIIAYSYCEIFQIPTKGDTPIFSVIIVFASLFYAFLGLLYLFKFLKKKFDFQTSIITVFLIYYATNLFYYSTAEPGMSHSFSFFLIAVLLFFTDKIYKDASPKNFIILGITLGLIVAVRTLNILVALFILFYNVNSFNDFKERIAFIYNKIFSFLILPLLTFVLFIPQFLYWYRTSGSFYTNPYNQPNTLDKGFAYLTNPKIAEVLFGVYGGWILFVPIIAVILTSLLLLAIKRKHNGLAVLFTFLPFLYLYSAWWFFERTGPGNRFFIDFYALLAIPLAFTISKTMIIQKKYLKYLVFFVFGILVYFNIRMTIGFKHWWFHIENWNYNFYMKFVSQWFFL